MISLKKFLVLFSIILGFSISVLPSVSFAENHSSLKFSNVWIKATLQSQMVASGYLVIENTGAENDRLLSITSDFAGKNEIHEMTMTNNVMKMRPLDNGIELPAGQKVELKAGGLHLMLMELAAPLAVGQSKPMSLTFEKAGTIVVDFPVLLSAPAQ